MQKRKDWFDQLIQDYRFYLAFENSICEDYVTEKLLLATQNTAVPVVWGGADYSMFLPPSAYLDARTMLPSLLAKKIQHLIHDDNAYAAMFCWRGQYELRPSHECSTTNHFCRLCAVLNGMEFNQSSVYSDLVGWWEEGIKKDNINNILYKV